MAYAGLLKQAAHALDKQEMAIDRLAYTFDWYLTAVDSGNDTQIRFQRAQLENTIKGLLGRPEDSESGISLQDYLAAKEPRSKTILAETLEQSVIR